MAYATEAEYDTYWNDRNVDISGQTSAQKTAALLVATEYLDDNYDFVGYRKDENQANKWPRTGAYNSEGILLDQDNVPQKVKNATIELAYLHLTLSGGLEPVDADGKVIRREHNRIGTLEQEIEYDTAKSENFIRSYHKAIKMIDDLIISGYGSMLKLDRVL